MKVAGIGSDALFKMLGELLEGKTQMSEKEVAAMCVGLYADFTKDYKPFLRAAPKLARSVSKDLTPIAAALMGLIADIAGSADVKNASASFAKAKADLRMIAMNAYIAAGFTRQQAFQLVLCDASQPFAGTSMMQKSLSSE